MIFAVGFLRNLTPVRVGLRQMTKKKKKTI